MQTLASQAHAHLPSCIGYEYCPYRDGSADQCWTRVDLTCKVSGKPAARGGKGRGRSVNGALQIGPSYAIEEAEVQSSSRGTWLFPADGMSKNWTLGIVLCCQCRCCWSTAHKARLMVAVKAQMQVGCTRGC